jgi:ribonuclease P protein component
MAGAVTANERFKFPREERLKSSSENSAVFKKGKSVSCEGARLFYRAVSGGSNQHIPSGHNGEARRIAFVFSRKFGCAAARNRARRIGREAYRLLRASLPFGFDFVLLVYPDANAKLDTRLTQLRVLLKKAHICAPRVNAPRVDVPRVNAPHTDALPWYGGKTAIKC